MKTIGSNIQFMFLISGFAGVPGCPPALAQSDMTGLTSTVKEVTVFLQGAQITRAAKVSLTKGTHTLIMQELPANIDAQSIQASVGENVVILSLMHQVNYLTGPRQNARLKVLQDSLRFYDESRADVNARLAVFKSEEELLNANRTLGGAENGLQVAELKLAADFFRSRLGEIKREQLGLNRTGQELDRKAERIRNQLNTMQAGLNKPTSEIVIEVLANVQLQTQITVSYLVWEAGWYPAYDVRVKDTEGPVQLAYNGKVFQNTGENWEQVNIRLSTADPRQRGDKPLLQPWFLDFSEPLPVFRGYNKMELSVAEEAASAEPLMVEDELMMKEKNTTVAAFTEVNESRTNLEFVVGIPYDIPADNRHYTINIRDYRLPAVFEYYSVPKLDADVFLMARITGWEEYNLLSGEASLFFEGTFVGQSLLDVRNTSDTLDLSLGSDRNIVVTRVKMKDFTARRSIGNTTRETHTWEITARNTRKTAVALKIDDQVPVSMNKDILVENLEYADGNYNLQTGKISWKYLLQPASEKKIRVSFDVKYPKDRQVFVD